MIEVKDLTFAYGGQAPIFDRFNWHINRCDAWSVIGPSGCGKTTLLYLLAGLRRPLSGAIRIDGTTIMRPRPRSGLVLQDHGLLPWSTVRENARLGLTIWEFYGSDGKHTPGDIQIEKTEADQRVDYWLNKLGINHLQNQYPPRLSRGQRQRTAIARTLVMEPDLLLLDEPFSALDAPTREDLQRVILHLHQTLKLTYIIVTHDIEVAVVMGRKILALGGGSNQAPNILDNEYAGIVDKRNHTAFNHKCDQLKKLLAELT